MKIRTAALLSAFALAIIPSTSAIASPPPGPSYIDQFKAGRGCDVYRQHPDFVWLESVGSLTGERHDALGDELTASLLTLQGMMDDVHVSSNEIVELRISATSEAYRKQLSAIIAANPNLARLPVSITVVDGFQVKWARVGLDAVLQSASANNVVSIKYGANSSCR